LIRRQLLQPRVLLLELLKLFRHTVASLIDDIETRGVRDKILLVYCGEMVRTPVINATDGRNHWRGLAPLPL
jgi:uncharacterized protein (DUF1501 family)